MGLGYWINPWWRETHSLDSENAPEVCRSQLIAATKSNLALWWGTGMLRSQFPGSDTIVLLRRPAWVRNSFGTVAAVRCQQGGRGTVMRVTLRSRYFTSAFMTFWLGAVLIFNVFLLYSVASGPASPLDLFPLLMLAFGIGFVVLGRLFARNEGAALLDFIRQTTGAETSVSSYV